MSGFQTTTIRHKEFKKIIKRYLGYNGIKNDVSRLLILIVGCENSWCFLIQPLVLHIKSNPPKRRSSMRAPQKRENWWTTLPIPPLSSWSLYRYEKTNGRPAARLLSPSLPNGTNLEILLRKVRDDFSVKSLHYQIPSGSKVPRSSQY